MRRLKASYTCSRTVICQLWVRIQVPKDSRIESHADSIPRLVHRKNERNKDSGIVFSRANSVYLGLSWAVLGHIKFVSSRVGRIMCRSNLQLPGGFQIVRHPFLYPGTSIESPENRMDHPGTSGCPWGLCGAPQGTWELPLPPGTQELLDDSRRVTQKHDKVF